ncbi:very short patch repair endonuclease [Rhizobium ruizarguesonis]
MDRITAERRSANMRQIKSKGMKPELLVRRLVHSMGFRFRLHRADLPGKPDLVFASRKKVIFVHGCFWHQHPECKHAHTPRSNSDYWLPKLSRNVARDAIAQEHLQEAGWKVLTIWECELKDSETTASRLNEFLGGTRSLAPHDFP